MSKVTVTMTREQLLAIWRCAGCAADTYDDALAVLGHARRVDALNAGMEIMSAALFGKRV